MRPDIMPVSGAMRRGVHCCCRHVRPKTSPICWQTCRVRCSNAVYSRSERRPTKPKCVRWRVPVPFRLRKRKTAWMCALFPTEIMDDGWNSAERHLHRAILLTRTARCWDSTRDCTSIPLDSAKGLVWQQPDGCLYTNCGQRPTRWSYRSMMYSGSRLRCQPSICAHRSMPRAVHLTVKRGCAILSAAMRHM